MHRCSQVGCGGDGAVLGWFRTLFHSLVTIPDRDGAIGAVVGEGGWVGEVLDVDFLVVVFVEEGAWVKS